MALSHDALSHDALSHDALSHDALSLRAGQKSAGSLSWCALLLLGVDGLTAAALGLTVTGWALIWAKALAVIEFVPLPLAVATFLLGLALIPLRSALPRRTTMPRR